MKSLEEALCGRKLGDLLGSCQPGVSSSVSRGKVKELERQRRGAWNRKVLSKCFLIENGISKIKETRSLEWEGKARVGIGCHLLVPSCQ